MELTTIASLAHVQNIRLENFRSGTSIEVLFTDGSRRGVLVEGHRYNVAEQLESELHNFQVAFIREDYPTRIRFHVA